MFLIDTDVLSALRRRERNPDIVRWMSGRRTTDFASECRLRWRDRAGDRAETAPRSSLRPRAGRLAGQPAQVVRRADTHRRSDRCAAVGRLSDTIGHERADLLIAATAIESGLAVVTRNVRHFAPTGAPALDPSAPPR